MASISCLASSFSWAIDGCLFIKGLFELPLLLLSASRPRFASFLSRFFFAATISFLLMTLALPTTFLLHDSRIVFSLFCINKVKISSKRIARSANAFSAAFANLWNCSLDSSSGSSRLPSKYFFSYGIETLRRGGR